MTARRTRTVVAVAGLVLAAALSGCGSDSPDSDAGRGSGGGSDLRTLEPGTLRVCSDIPYKPFDILEGDVFTGFDGDLVNEIATGLDLELQVRDAGFDSLQSGLALEDGQCDMVASAMTITEEREQNLDFTDGYYDSAQSMMVPAGSDLASLADLAGKRVGVQQDTTGKSYTEDHAPSDAEVVVFPSDAEMFNGIKAGQVDALLQDLPVNLAHTEDGDFEIVEQYDTGEEYGFAVEQDNTGLRDAVNERLAALREDGTYDRIYAEYFATG